jgi:isopentenyl diphosphate isomerase/L-lactate dehydrogenase-like FMN-dependent dehydrogenase
VAWWVQAYLPQERSLAIPMLEAAASAGARAVVLTVDTPVVATKYDGGAVWHSTPADWLRVNLGPATDAPKARDLGPADVAWLHKVTGLPVVLKGVLRPEAAASAVVAGAAAVWVSNHGGRQLDRAVATADALPRGSSNGSTGLYRFTSTGESAPDPRHSRRLQPVQTESFSDGCPSTAWPWQAARASGGHLTS